MVSKNRKIAEEVHELERCVTGAHFGLDKYFESSEGALSAAEKYLEWGFSWYQSIEELEGIHDEIMEHAVEEQHNYRHLVVEYGGLKLDEDIESMADLLDYNDEILEGVDFEALEGEPRSSEERPR